MADVLGYGDADALMSAVSEAGRTIAWVGDDVWRRRSRWPTGASPAAVVGWARRAVEDGTVTVAPAEPGVALQVTGAGQDTEVVRRTTPTRPTPPSPCGWRPWRPSAPFPSPVRHWRSSPPRWRPRATRGRPSCATRSVRVLATGGPAIAVLEALDQKGLLVRLLPEWAAVRNRPQRNAYHRFTVDRHLLEAAAEAAALTGRVERPDLLLLGALLHDIGKGFPGDHTDAGVALVTEDLGPRLALPADDTAVVAGLVRNHLLLSEVATRRDLDDPATLDTVAKAVHDTQQLDLLAALTEADSLATGSAAWGPWKAGLVASLVERVTTRLAGGEVGGPRSSPTATAASCARWSASAGRWWPWTSPTWWWWRSDRPGPLSAVAGVFALRGLDVRSADVAGEDGFAVETFVVESARGRWPDFELVADELEAVLRGTLPIAARLAQQARTYADARRPVSPYPVQRTVTADNDASVGSTVVELRAEDSVGLLYRVTAALFALDLDVVAARVATIGHEVVDAFYVRDTVSGGKVWDIDRIGHICDSVARAAESVE